MRRLGLIICGAMCAIFCLFIGLYFLSAHNIKQRESHLAQLEEEEYLSEVENLLAEGNAEEALSMIKELKEEIEEGSFTSSKWSDLLITACMDLRDIPQLIALFDFTPELLLEHEEAALMIAEHYLETGQLQKYQVLRGYWRGYEHADEAWLSFDVDKLLAEERRSEAIALLNSRTFSGESDVPRLLRLTTLTMHEEPKEAWNYLTKAAKKDPSNAEVRFLRGQLLEQLGDEEAALNEYLGALDLSPQNPSLKNFIGDLFIRKKAYGDAIRFWGRNLDDNCADEAWIKFLFWKQVVGPALVQIQPPQGSRILQQYAHYLSGLKPGEFWKNDSFQQILYSRDLQKTEQSTFWLKLIQSLKQNKLREAWQLLHNNAFYVASWNKDLEDALKHLLIYRGLGAEEVIPETLSFQMLNIEHSDDFFPLLATLAKHAQPGNPAMETKEELDEFLQSKDAIAAIFLKSGWVEAARHLYPYESPAKHAPEWVTLDFITALADNLSIAKAIEYASIIPTTPRFPDHIFSLLQRAAETESEILSLHKRAQQSTENGYRLANFLSQVYLDHNHYHEAKKIILDHKLLQNSVQGQERLARIAIHLGDQELAERIYSKIEKESVEAKSYQARKAYNERNWQRAKELTEDLLREFPDNPTLKDNLRTLTAMQ